MNSLNYEEYKDQGKKEGTCLWIIKPSSHPTFQTSNAQERYLAAKAELLNDNDRKVSSTCTVAKRQGGARMGPVVYGWSIIYFTDLKELLTVIRDAVKDHQTMYESGILHRDVSIENILIQPVPPNSNLPIRTLVSQTRGRLVDSDHARWTGQKQVPKIISNDITQDCQKRISDNVGVTEETVVQAGKFVSVEDASFYCDSAIEYNVLNSDPINKWSSKDLGWEDVHKFSFISHKLLQQNREVTHHAIHDMESFWWILVYICLTRQPAGGGCENDSEDYDELICNIFEEGPLGETNVGRTKSSYFQRKHVHAFDRLMKQFLRYFEPLKPMLKRWRNLLMLGYDFEAYEFHLIHKYVVAIIEDTLKDLPVTQTVSAVTENELRRRENAYAPCLNRTK